MVIIREATAQDAHRIAVVEQETSGTPWSEEVILHDIVNNDRATVTVAEFEGRVVGYSDVWHIAGEAQLNNIAVTATMRGRHIAERMLDDMIGRAAASGDTLMTLEVRTGNVPAISLYRKLGFADAGIRTGYYSDNGDDALLMDLDILKYNERKRKDD